MLNRLYLLPLVFSLLACGATSEVAINEPLPTARPLAAETPQPMAEPAVKTSPSPQASAPLASTPLASSSPSPASSPSAVPSDAPLVLKQGAFRNGFHKVSGQAQLVQLESRSVLRLENFYTENGPDLYVYLVRNETGTPRNDQDYINLGKLRSTTGSFNVDIPAGVDLSGVQSATIWCQAFRVNFGFARFQTP